MTCNEKSAAENAGRTCRALRGLHLLADPSLVVPRLGSATATRPERGGHEPSERTSRDDRHPEDDHGGRPERAGHARSWTRGRASLPLPSTSATAAMIATARDTKAYPFILNMP